MNKIEKIMATVKDCYNYYYDDKSIKPMLRDEYEKQVQEHFQR